MAERTCKNCGKPVTSVNPGRGNWARWCSTECRTEATARTRQEWLDRRGPCRIPGCLTAARNATTDVCDRHYYQLRRSERPSRSACQTVGCDRLEIGKHRLCAWHYATRPLKNPPVMSDTWWGGTDVSYATAHARVSAAKGKARSHACVDCGGPAQQWSYDYNDPNERAGKGGPHGFSPECYSPRCFPCHGMFDSEMNAARAGSDDLAMPVVASTVRPG